MQQEPPDIEVIFFAALQTHSADECAQYLEQACGDNTDLRKQIETLLKAHEKAKHSFLEAPATGFRASQPIVAEREVGLDPAAMNASPPATIGPIFGPDRVLDANPDSLNAGFAATFGPNAAVIVSGAGHSVLKSLSKKLTQVPHVTLHESQADRDAIVQPRSPELHGKGDDSRYHLMGEIARGGMGAIIKGRDTDLGRDIAIKVLLDTHKNKPELIQRFVEEAQIGGQLQHPGIVPVYELGQFGDQRPFFSMKLVKGKTLAELLSTRRNPQENLPKLLGIFEQICQAMAYVHSKGVVHRDLKPANIMLGTFGEVQVMDWGLSKVLSKGGVADERKSLDKQRNVSVIQTRRSVGSDVPGDVGSNTQLGSVMGTPAYMPPEQALGEIDRLDERADVFGLGAILAEILSGKPPYVADDATQVYRMASRGKLEECFVRLDASGVDGELIDLAKLALSAEVEDRPRNAGELSAGITKHLEGVQSRLKQAEFAKVEAETRSEEQRRRKRLYMAIAGMLFLLAVSGAAVSAMYMQKAETLAELARSESKQAEEAQHNSEVQVRLRQAAEKETQRAKVMLLAAEAQRIEHELPILSVLLAMEAVRMSDEHKLWPLPIAHATLLKSLANLGGTPLQNQLGGLRGMTMSQNDRMVTGSFEGFGVSDNDYFQVWNLTNDTAASSLKLELENGMRAWSSAISANGQRVVTGSNRSARVWELSAEGDRIMSWFDLPGQSGNVLTAISPDGQWIVTSGGGFRDESGNRPGKIQLFRIDESGQATLVTELGPFSKVTEFAFSPNNEWLVMVAGDETEIEGRAFLWDLRSTDIAGSVKSLEHTGMNPSVAIGPEGRWLATGSSDGVRLFDLKANDVPATVRKLTSEKIRKVTISQNGRWLIGAGKDSWLFDLSALEPAASAIILRGHESSGESVAISRNGSWLATGDKIARIWDLNSIDPLELPILKDRASNSARLWDVKAFPSKGRTRVLRGHGTSVSHMHFTSDSRRLITSGLDGAIRSWDNESDNPGSATVLLGHDAQINLVSISPDLRWLVTASEDHTARLWDLTSDSPSASSIILPHPEFVRTIAISPDSHWLVTASGHFSNGSPGVATEARVWDLTVRDPSKTMRLLSGHEKFVTHVKVSPDSRRVVTLSTDGTARVWSLDGTNPNQEPRVLSGHEKFIASVAFSPDSNSLVTGDLDGIIRFWNLSAPEPIEPRKLLDHENWVLGLSLDNSRVRALTAGWLKKTHISELDLNSITNSKSRELPNVGIFYIHATDFFGNMMCLPNVREAQVWDLSDSQSKTPTLIHAHEAGVASTAFSPDGSLFASCSNDLTARISHLSTVNPLNTTLVLRGHESKVNSVAISADNRWLLTGSNDHTARLWDLDIKKLMARAQKLVGRELTDAERERYLIPKRK